MESINKLLLQFMPRIKTLYSRFNGVRNATRLGVYVNCGGVILHFTLMNGTKAPVYAYQM